MVLNSIKDAFDRVAKKQKLSQKFLRNLSTQTYLKRIVTSNLIPSLLTWIIASHFYRQGLFDLVDCFINEAEEPETAVDVKLFFHKIYQIVEAMKRKNLVLALTWATINSDKLKKSNLELELHSLQFIEILQSKPKEDALTYARTHFGAFAEKIMLEIQKLMA